MADARAKHGDDKKVVSQKFNQSSNTVEKAPDEIKVVQEETLVPPEETQLATVKPLSYKQWLKEEKENIDSLMELIID